ncbi:ATP-NAD kinase-like domain [Pseudocohnilembus persalinus]|uniref:ATP-NAD kinase-like domain n=1 Tax=Pseudocohnilembus persalinus TaxID=266149 RepID=A0A0V0Q836_PSEPJ|nr:ATP-NAD kinase-like domain [Pseudocohnilembus persalinus]|eukprot:KRW98353.1 ATP-NAD kinase-like domain [Pseudocohnilembus persalinus]
MENFKQDSHNLNQNFTQENKLVQQQKFKAGPGNSQKNWENNKQVIIDAGYLPEIIVSSKRNHIQEYIKNIKKEQLQQFTGIIIFSGDGLPHEVINGLMNRVDRKELVDIGICPVPSGSGNAFAQELNTRANLQNSIVSSLFNFIKGKKQKMDLIQLLLDQNKIVYSFLSLNFSYVADIDINSEFLRCLGGTRFDIYGTYRALIQKGENAKLSLKESENIDNNNEKTNETQQQIFKQENIFQGKFKYLQFNNISYLSESCRSAPFSQINDGKIDVQFLLNCSYCNFVNMALKFTSGKQFDKKTQQTVVDQLQHKFVEEFELECENKDTLISVDGEKFLVKTVKGKIMPLAFSVFCIQ